MSYISFVSAGPPPPPRVCKFCWHLSQVFRINTVTNEYEGCGPGEVRGGVLKSSDDTQITRF